jgi:hypothetical protein
MSKRVRILLGGIVLGLLTAYIGVYVYSITLPRKGSSDGWSGSWDGKGEPYVTSVDRDGRDQWREDQRRPSQPGL